MRRRVIPGVLGAGLLGGLLWWFGGQPAPQPPAPPPPTQPAPAPTDLSGLVDAHNRERAKVGAPALRESSLLFNAAQKHADWMSANRNMSHTGAGGSSFADRIAQQGYRFRTGGENIANGYRDVPSVMNGWMNSAGHRANILNPAFKEIGVGRTGNYWCTVFATPLGGPAQGVQFEPVIIIQEQPPGITAGELDEFGP